MPRVTLYKTPAGNDVVADFISQQPANDRRVIQGDLRAVEVGYPVGMPLCKHLNGDLWEVRSSLPSKRKARFIFFYESKSKMIMVVHGFIKTTQRTPKREMDVARQRRKEFG